MTMLDQDNWWANDKQVEPPSGQAPAPAYIPFPAKPADPIELQRLDLSRQANDRANNAADRAATAQERTADATIRQAGKMDFDKASTLRDDYERDASVKAFTRAIPAYMASLNGAGTPAADLALTYAFATMMDPQSAVREGEQAMQSSGDTLYGQTVAKLKKELGEGGAFRPEYRNQLLQQMRARGSELRKVYDSVRRDFEGRAKRAGVEPADVLPADPAAQFGDAELRYWAKQGDAGAAAELQKRTGGAGAGPNGALQDALKPPTGPRGERLLAADEQVSFAGDERPATAPRYSPEQEAQIVRAIRDGDLGQVLALHKKFSGNDPDEDTIRSAGMAIAAVRKDPRTEVSVGYGSADTSAQEAADRERYGDFLKPAMESRKDLVADPLIRGAADTGSFGTADELAAGVSTLFGGGTMKENLQRERAIDEADRRVNGGPRFTGQLGGGILNPLGRGATTPGQVARAGGAGGALYGFGSGETLADRASGAALTGVTGAAGGYLISRGVNALAPKVAQGASALGNRISNALATPERVAAREARATNQQNALLVARAGEAENVPVSRAMIDPTLENAVTGSQATLGGGPVVDRSLKATAEGIQKGVQRLGGNGEPLVAPVAGEKVTGAAIRFIKQSGERARRLYDRADELTGGAKVAPKQSAQEVDGLIQTLGETPNTNSAELNFLKSLREDLSNDLSVGGLRRIRTSLRKKISRGELVFGEDEARVLGIMDKASADIADGLRAAGKGEAADAFSMADRMYRERMDFIGGTIQKVIGKRGANTPEQALGRLQAMASPKGDAAGFGRMMRLLEPDEQADIAATFADALGKNNKGDFSTAILLNQAQKLPAAARRDLFGEEGSESLNNLLTLAKEHSRVYGKLNHSRSGVATLARDYRSWLSGLMGIGTTLAVNDVKGMAATAVAGGLTMGKDAVTARALMTPAISRWLRQAPRSASPEAINAHIKKLSRIASNNPALAGEVAAIEQQIGSAIRQLPQGAAASGPTPDRN